MSKPQDYMNIALNQAKRVVGLTAPNPAVGCVIVKNDQIIAAAHTAINGRPHAEENSLKIAGKEAKAATMYVTLEPCCHEGSSGACTERIIAAGIKEVFIACLDLYHEVNGLGVKQLEQAGIKVYVGLLQEQAEKVNRGFIKKQQKSLPFITLKLATSIDGKIATRKYDSKWLSNEQSRAYAHMLRAKNDAILVGINTVLQDDPILNCRLPGMEQQSPIRIVVDSSLKIPLDSKLVKSAKNIALWVITCTKLDDNKAKKLKAKGVNIISAPNKNGQVDLTKALQEIAKNGINNILCEGGSQLAKSLLEQKLVDELILIKAPKLIGADGIDAFSLVGVDKVSDSAKLKLISSKQIQDDIVLIYGVVVN